MKTTDKTTQELREKLNKILGELSASTWYKATNASELKDSTVDIEELRKATKAILSLIAKHEAELVESELMEAEKMNKHYSDRGKPNPFYQGQVIVLRHMLTALTEKESKE